MVNQNNKQITHSLPARPACRPTGRLMAGLSPRWWTALGIIIMIPCFPFTHLTAQERVRKPAVAGYFYPKDRKELTKTVDDFISNVKPTQIAGKIVTGTSRIHSMIQSYSLVQAIVYLSKVHQ
jgi:hypothetical protein